MAREDQHQPDHVEHHHGGADVAEAAPEPPGATGWRVAVARALLQGWGRTVALAGEVNAGFVRDRVTRGRLPVIFALWHDRLFYIVHYLTMRYTYRQHPCVVLVSASGDGALVGGVIRRLRAEVAWGSSTRGALAGMRGVLRAAHGRRQASPIVTLDGPRGPRHVVKPGVIAIARATGLPIVPVSAALRRPIVLAGSWDRFVLPMPGTRATVVYGDPVVVGPGDDDEGARAALQAGMDRLTRDVEGRERPVVIGRERARRAVDS